MRYMPTSKKKINKWIKEGRGSGTLSNYQPWLNIRSFSSRGKTHRVKGIKTGRSHHLFSDPENDVFTILDMSKNVLDIQEQFPLLPLLETIAIAEQLGITHPVDPVTKSPIVITTDFRITLINGTVIVRTVKTVGDLENEEIVQRILEKYEIERWYWKKRGVDWGIITDLDIPEIMAKNCNKLHQFWYLNGYKIPVKDVLPIYEYLIPGITAGNRSLKLITKECDQHFGFDRGTSMNACRHFIARKYYHFDFNSSFDPEKIFLMTGYDTINDFTSSFDSEMP